MSVLDLVGNTPMLRLDGLLDRKGVSLLAKAEFLNPSGSVKDRAAKSMILDGIERGELSPGKTIMDATSGNTGIALAMLGAALGYPVRIYMPANASGERKRLIRAYGASIVETDPMEGSDGAYEAARKAASQSPGEFFYPDQYNNPANPLAHYNGTGPEILAQSNGEVTHFICGAGTAGTFLGTSRRLKEVNPAIRCYAVQPDSPYHGIEGTRHMATTSHPDLWLSADPDGIIEVTTEKAAECARILARRLGVLAGVSSGANVAGALKIAEGADEGSVIVTVICDGGARYLSGELFGAGPEEKP